MTFNSYHGGVLNVLFTEKLLKSVQSASTRRKFAFSVNRQKSEAEKEAKKRCAELDLQLKAIEQKKANLLKKSKVLLSQSRY